MNKGFVVLAQNTHTVDYIKCAEILAKSIKKVMPDTPISLITTDVKTNPWFDSIIQLPYGDLDPDSNWKLLNDWQVYEASPYDYTIKLEADLYIPYSIDYWWEVLAQQDVVISTTIRSYNQEISHNRYYRYFIDSNYLPNCYNAITYFKKSETADYFFKLIKNIFENWELYKTILQCKRDEEVTTDWAYALACHIIGPDKTTMPAFTEMSMVHLKQAINNLNSIDWTDELLYEVLPHCIRINTVPQKYPVHYHVKKFANILEKFV